MSKTYSHDGQDYELVPAPKQSGGQCVGCSARYDQKLCFDVVTNDCTSGQTRGYHLRPVKVVRAGVGQSDPNGKDLHSPGAKADAGKAEYDMALFSFPNAIAAVDRIGKFGAKKYTKGGFLDVPNGQARYLNAEIRHAAQHEGGETHDPESKELHLAHKAWNALAHLELYLRGKGE